MSYDAPFIITDQCAVHTKCNKIIIIVAIILLMILIYKLIRDKYNEKDKIQA
jgi:hypothetical protein